LPIKPFSTHGLPMQLGKILVVAHYNWGRYWWCPKAYNLIDLTLLQIYLNTLALCYNNCNAM